LNEKYLSINSNIKTENLPIKTHSKIIKRTNSAPIRDRFNNLTIYHSGMIENVKNYDLITNEITNKRDLSFKSEVSLSEK
jgi:hypothetical protein